MQTRMDDYAATQRLPDRSPAAESVHRASEHEKCAHLCGCAVLVCLCLCICACVFVLVCWWICVFVFVLMSISAARAIYSWVIWMFSMQNAIHNVQCMSKVGTCFGHF